MTTFDQILRLAQQLPPGDQERLRIALVQTEAAVRAEQVAHNQEAIAMLDAWSTSKEEDDGSESWDEMLSSLDRHRESTRVLYPHLHPDLAKQIS